MTPPLLARWVLARLLPAADRDFFLGDLAEEYAEHAETEGIAAARRWYRRQAIHSLPPLARRRLTPSALSPRQIGGGSMWRDLVDDLQYALRLTRRGPLVALVVITTMVLGIGVTAAMFSVVNGVLLKPLPFADSERVVRIGSTFRDRKISSAYPDLVDIRRIVRGFEAVSATSFDEMTLQHGPDPRLIQLARVDQDYARVFSIRPLAGRLFDSRDVQPGAPKVVVLSYDFWRQEFGSDHAIVGQAITLNNESHQVVGILPRQAFAFPTNGFLALVPLIAVPGTSMERRGSMWITAAAKLRPGVSSDRAREELGQAAAQIARDNPATNEVIGAWLTPLREFVVGDVGSMLLLLAASVAAVLLIACANIANLLLGQSTARAREFAVRSAIGGGTGRIVRQVLTESMLLAAIGGGLGMLLAPVLTRAILAGYPGELPRVGEVGVDARVLGVAVVVTLFAGLLAGIPTAQRAVVRDLSRAIRDGGRTGARRSRSGYVLIAAQVAASLTLVFAAALLLKTLSRLFRTDPGFDPRGVVTFQVALSAARHRDGEAI
ncbi:MAG: hypothetical protein HOP28_13815, partial [Gemmatimonadales bacterium]|nr:hypothetical protein [Gemmatimonadales bacterium]